MYGVFGLIMASKNNVISGHVYSLDPHFGNGGVGYIKDCQGTQYFFHSSYVSCNQYHKLEVGSEVTFKPIGARSAIGAGPQARNVLMSNKTLNK